MERFLIADQYVDFQHETIQALCGELFSPGMDSVERARTAYLYVRDHIPHSFDCQAQVITARASDVLKHGTGICHAKANLLAALLRSQGIPAGFCFQRLTLEDDDSLGYCVHCYNAVFLDGKWIKVDARGNKEGVNARFSLEEPVLAFYPRPEYDEYFYPGIYASPHQPTMEMLQEATCLQDVLDNIPDTVTEPSDILE
ncbi:MAG: transglutaminase domain-containing protein [Ruminiclostridium sp.]|nr:transglutaminase domain-containing protein [Ruminiclostridium sp.]